MNFKCQILSLLFEPAPKNVPTKVTHIISNEEVYLENRYYRFRCQRKNDSGLRVVDPISNTVLWKDNIVWARTAAGDVRRSDQERDQLFRGILNQDHWIVEGAPRDILHESFAECDYIFFLDVSTVRRLYRVLRRWIRQRLGAESYNSAPTLCFLFYNLKWVFEFNKAREEILCNLNTYGDKLKIFRNFKSAKQFIVKVYI